MKQPAKSNLLKAAILTMSFVQMSTNGIAPILADIAKAFPEASTQKVQFLMTFPSIFSVVFMLISSAMADRIGKKRLALSGLSIVGLAGLGAFFFHPSITVLFAWAAVLGTGVGLVCPVAPALIAESFAGREQQTMLGLQNSAANIGSMLMTFFGGLLAACGWWFGYLVFLLGIPGILLTILAVPQKGGKQAKKQSKRPNLLGIWPELLVSFLFMIAFSSVPSNLSMLTEEKGLGGAQIAGIFSTLFLAGGMAAGFIYGRLARILRINIVLLGGVTLAAGALIGAFSTSVVVTAIACFIGGMSISLLMPLIMETPARYPECGSLVVALIMSASNIGVFCGPLLTKIVNAISGADLAANRFIAIAVLAVLISILARVLLGKKTE